MLSTCGEAGQSRGYRVDTDAYVCGSSYAVVIVIHVQQLFGPLLSIDASCPSSEAGPPWTRTCENHGRDRESLEALLVNTRTVGAGCPFPHFASPGLIFPCSSPVCSFPHQSSISPLAVPLPARDPQSLLLAPRERDGPHHTRREIRKEDKGHKARREQRRAQRCCRAGGRSRITLARMCRRCQWDRCSGRPIRGGYPDKEADPAGERRRRGGRCG